MSQTINSYLSYKTVFFFRMLSSSARYAAPKCYQVKNHLIEYHSGVGYICSLCTKVFSRRQTHPDCTASPQDLDLFDKQTRAKGKEVEEKLRKFKEEMPKKWVESIRHQNEYQGGIPHRPISPLPKSPITRKSPLEKVDPGSANLTYSRRVAEKRSKSASANPQSTPNKKQRPDQTDEVDLVNDPMDISLEQPCDFLFAPVDKQYQHVQFSPPLEFALLKD